MTSIVLFALEGAVTISTQLSAPLCLDRVNADGLS